MEMLATCLETKLLQSVSARRVAPKLASLPSSSSLAFLLILISQSCIIQSSADELSHEDDVLVSGQPFIRGLHKNNCNNLIGIRSNNTRLSVVSLAARSLAISLSFSFVR